MVVIQSTVAMILSLIAVGGVIFNGGKAAVETLAELIPSPNIQLDLASVSVTDKDATFAVGNRTERVVAIQKVTCVFELPIKVGSHWRRRLQSLRTEAESDGSAAYKANETIGPFLVVYTPNAPLLLEGRSQALLPANVTIVGAPIGFDPSEPGSEDQPASSYCMVMGKDNLNQAANGVMLLSPEDYYSVDALELLAAATFEDPDDPDDPRRDELIAFVKAQRAYPDVD